MSGVPRGVASVEINGACTQIGWTAIGNRQEIWWHTAAEDPAKWSFLWNEHHVLLERTTNADIRKTRKTEPKKQQVAKKAVVAGDDPLFQKDPWSTFKPSPREPPSGPPSTRLKPTSASTPASSSTPPVQVSHMHHADPCVSALAERVEKLEGATQQLHGKVDGISDEVHTMNDQFAEVLKLLGTIHEKKRVAPSWLAVELVDLNFRLQVFGGFSVRSSWPPILEFTHQPCRGGDPDVVIWAANVTSFCANWQAVLIAADSARASFIVLTEVKACHREQQWLTAACRARGWTHCWSEPILLQGRQGRSGGVAILASRQWLPCDAPCALPMLAATHNHCLSAWHSVATGELALIMGYCGLPHAAVQTRHDILLACSELRHYSVAIVAMNMEFTDEECAAVDFMDVRKMVHLHYNRPRPDCILIPARLWPILEDAVVQQETMIPTHSVVVATLVRGFYRGALSRRTPRLRPRPAVSLTSLQPADTTYTSWAFFWETFLGGNDPDFNPIRFRGARHEVRNLHWSRPRPSRWIQRLANFTNKITTLKRMASRAGPQAIRLWRRIAAQALPFLSRYGVEEVTDAVLDSMETRFHRCLREQLWQSSRDKAHAYRIALHTNHGVNRTVSRATRADAVHAVRSLCVEEPQ